MYVDIHVGLIRCVANLAVISMEQVFINGAHNVEKGKTEYQEFWKTGIAPDHVLRYATRYILEHQPKPQQSHQAA